MLESYAKYVLRSGILLNTVQFDIHVFIYNDVCIHIIVSICISSISVCVYIYIYIHIVVYIYIYVYV